MTDAEKKLWQMLRAKRLEDFKFRRQQPIGPFIVDFVCQSEQLVIEADGSQHADSPDDVRRTEWLEARGYRVLRFWNGDVLRRPDDVVMTIYRTLTAPSPRSPSASRPSLSRGEGKDVP
jgi:very-short-patch-repair endonuclease